MGVGGTHLALATRQEVGEGCSPTVIETAKDIMLGNTLCFPSGCSFDCFYWFKNGRNDFQSL